MSSFERGGKGPPGIREFTFPPLEREEGWKPSSTLAFAPLVDREPETASHLEEDITAQARQILAAALEQRQHIEREAYEQGFAQGRQDGLEVGRRGLEEVTQRLAAVAESLAGCASRLYQEWEENLTGLVLAIARKVVGRDLAAAPAEIRTFLEQGFQAVSCREGLKLHLHPQDLEAIGTLPEGIWPPQVEVVADPTLTPGGFFLETAWGDLDGTVEQRWERVFQIVAQALENDNADQTS